MYRALTYHVKKQGVDLVSGKGLEEALGTFTFTIQEEGAEKRYFLDQKDITAIIRSEEITKDVSTVAAHPIVRQSLVSIQREFSKGRDAVFEGRDMGTVVFPHAEAKFYLTATPEVRAQRRYQECLLRNEQTNLEKVLQDLLIRDHQDSTRKVSPLKRAEDAHLVDTSDLMIEEVVEEILALIPQQNT
jgi:cytidylate kinase